MTGLDLTLIQRRAEALLAPWAEQRGPGATLGIVLEDELAGRHGERTG